ncbi:MAG: beta-N-acetylhexosaminidase [Clostridia bacterium]|nr:beta-N-acetylhexosaminidase [Clostridia bacterium]MBR0444421.1 beta-N-acetylhexosaminidase [Clostridia bacterium]
MREKSLKWMIGALFILAILIAGVWSGIHALKSRTAVPQPVVEQVQEEPEPTSFESQLRQTAQPTENPPEEPTFEPSPAQLPKTEEPTENLSADPTPGPETLQGRTEEELLKEYIAGMSVQDKIGQLVMFGFSGTSTVSKDFRRILSKYHVGNVVLYGSNIFKSDESGGFDTARKLTRRLENANETGIPFLISIDIEGGVVLRFRWHSAPNSARTLGKKNDYDLAYKQFFRVGEKLKDVGINMNLAPVLDISENAMKTVLRSRIISGNPEVAANIGNAIINGLRDAKCLSTAKHFPGHGGTTQDSHATTPVIRKSLEEMKEYDLIPFQAAVDNGVDTVLVAHISYPKIDDQNIASLSEIFITKLLREEMGHTGLIMSDDFRMTGVTSQHTVGEAAVQFILAGGDIILCGPRHDLQEKIMEGLTNAAESGALTEARLDESVYRILSKKMKVTEWNPMQASASEEADS